MPWVSGLRRFRLLPLVALSLLAACDEAVLEGSPAPCSALIEVEPRFDIVVRVAEVRRVHVQIRQLPDREPNYYRGCPEGSGARLTWTIDDPNVARIVEYSTGVWTITGLAVGETSIRLRHHSPFTEISKRLKVVEQPSVTWTIPVDTGCGETVCPG